MRWFLGMLALSAASAPAPGQPGHPPPVPPTVHPGQADCVSPLAKPGRSPHETGGYVGGGCLFGGTGRGPADGTWGWDYVGPGWLPHRVFLRWCGCRKQQPLAGYKTEGPHVPDVFAKPPFHEAGGQTSHKGK